MHEGALVTIAIATVVAICMYVWVSKTDARVREAKYVAGMYSDSIRREWTRIQRLKQFKEEQDAIVRERAYSRAKAMFDTIRQSRSMGPFEKVSELMKLYKRGLFPSIRPDEHMAKKCARCIAMYAPNSKVAMKHEAMRILLEPEIHDVDIQSDSPPAFQRYGHEAIDECLRIGTKERVLTRLKRAPPQPPRVPLQEQELRVQDDTQNSHDHGVVRSICEKIKTRNITKVPETAVDKTTRDVQYHIANHRCMVSDDAKARALTALESLGSEVYHPEFLVDEASALHHIWKDAPDKDSVVLQLAEMVENGGVVCHTGKMARIIGCLDTTCDDIIQPIWAIKAKLLHTAASIRDAVLQHASDTQKQAYEMGLEDDLKHKMIDRFRSSSKDEVLLLQPTIAQNLLEEIESGF